MGFTNIKIYNGGLKDWKKSGYKIDAIDPLPGYEGRFLTADELLTKLNDADRHNCADENNKAMVTLVDYRNENFLKTEKPLPSIKTGCPTIKCFLDNLKDPAVRNKIPKKGLVVLVCETGNRDAVAMRYLHKYGYNNVVGLRTGMRGWIKLDYPVEFSK